MKPDGSFTCSQEPATGPYTEPNKPSPHSYILSLQDVFTLFSHLCLSLQSGSFLQVLQLKFCMHFSSLSKEYVHVWGPV
jgi:hypothetical protein